MQNVRNLLFVYALLHGTRFLGRARVIWTRRGTCAGSAGVIAGRGSGGARTCGALFHGAVLRRTRSSIALASRTTSRLRGLRECGGCCESEDAG